ncbi:hypothetical protein QL093DRAFT_2355358 [Fusarium oxysporum]|nr:hypothetical protein QL093DRAFT_2355358 [Fusarium oxysporum]
MYNIHRIFNLSLLFYCKMGQQNLVLHLKLFSVLLRLGELASAMIVLGILSRFVYLIGIA